MILFTIHFLFLPGLRWDHTRSRRRWWPGRRCRRWRTETTRTSTSTWWGSTASRATCWWVPRCVVTSWPLQPPASMSRGQQVRDPHPRLLLTTGADQTENLLKPLIKHVLLFQIRSQDSNDESWRTSQNQHGLDQESVYGVYSKKISKIFNDLNLDHRKVLLTFPFF